MKEVSAWNNPGSKQDINKRKLFVIPAPCKDGRGEERRAILGVKRVVKSAEATSSGKQMGWRQKSGSH